jgi:hypothetical protein
MSEFFNSIFPFGAFFILTLLILISYYIIKEGSVFLYETINEFFFPTPKLPKKETNRIYKEAADFVHSKHRPWMYDDTFAEYLGLVHELSKKRWNELYGNNQN